MTAFDADVPTLIHEGHTDCVQKAALIPDDEQCVPVPVVEPLLRGRLNIIRQAQAGKAKVTIEFAYELLEATMEALRLLRLLSFSAQAETLVQAWRKQKIR